MVLPSSKVNFAGHIPNREKLTLQRYFMKYLVKAPFPVREIGTAMALLHPSHQPQDIIRIQGFQGQHHFQ
jgi:hypothetical protein